MSTPEILPLPLLPPGLATLFEEMQALMGVLPPAPPLQISPDETRADRVALFGDEALEEGFDNMPV